MGIYKFKLQKLLDIRISKEEESKGFFIEAQRQRQIVKDKLQDLNEKYVEYNKNSNEETVVERKIRLNYLNTLCNMIDDTTIELKDREIKLEEKRIELNQKQIERKTVEILKEKQLHAYTKEQELIEQKSNDEFALYAFIRHLERR